MYMHVHMYVQTLQHKYVLSSHPHHLNLGPYILWSGLGEVTGNAERDQRKSPRMEWRVGDSYSKPSTWWGVILSPGTILLSLLQRLGPGQK
jgi:hypothetical protein